MARGEIVVLQRQHARLLEELEACEEMSRIDSAWADRADDLLIAIHSSATTMGGAGRVSIMAEQFARMN